MDITIKEFELLNTEEYEVYDEETKTWVRYNESCYFPEGGFPDIATANEEILLITKYDSIHNRFIIYTARDVDVLDDVIEKYGINVKETPVVISKAADEYNLLKTFCVEWQQECPDVITGWNIDLFDVPYLVRRINRVLGDSFSAKLSPWNQVRERYVKINNEDQLMFDIVGINQLDYIQLMRKYTYGGRESWKLDNIAHDELGMKKLEYDGTFKDHYTKDFSHFGNYNLIDVHLVKKLDDKMKLIELALTIAYDSKIVPDEVFSQIRSWDSLIYNELKKKNIVIPNSKRNSRDQFEGAYVKDPIVGKHKWVVSFDLQSLYPHLMLWANISPETIVEYRKNVTVEGLLNKKHDNSDLPEHQYSMAANGVCFRKDFMGFIPEIVTRIYNERSIFKKQMLVLEQEYSNTKNKDLVPEISRLHNLQMARKIQINSVYGAMGSPYFRYYDLRMAEGITTSGQLAIRWVSNDLNDYLNKVCKTTNVDYCVYNDTDSVVGETMVYVNGKQQTIESLFDQHMTYEKYDANEKNYVKPVDGISTLSINTETGNIEEKQIKYVMKHRVKKKMFCITSASGKKVIVTQDHSIVVYRDNKIISVCPSDLLASDKIINIMTQQQKEVSLYGISKIKENARL